MENETSTTTPAPSSPPPAPKAGVRTSEFWIAAGVILLNHLSQLLRGSQTPTGQAAGEIIDGVVAVGYAIARSLVKRGGAAVVALVVAVSLGAASLPGCAHVPVKACTQNLTEDLTASASAALAGDDYEHRIEVAFAGVAACLVVAAVEAAIDQAKTIKFAGPRAAAVTSTIQLHGEAWLTAHRRT